MSSQLFFFGMMVGFAGGFVAAVFLASQTPNFLRMMDEREARRRLLKASVEMVERLAAHPREEEKP